MSYTDNNGRTATSVLQANYKTEATIEKKDVGPLSSGHHLYVHNINYTLSGANILTRNCKFSVAPDNNEVTISIHNLALGYFSENLGRIRITKEEFEYLKEVWR